MPFSSESGKSYIAKLLQEAAPRTVLDVGAGSGTYLRFKQPKQCWTALEVWEPTVEKYGLRDKYDQVIIEDARSHDFGVYDVVILGDILEHMTKDEAADVLKRCRKSRLVIVSIPLGHYPQDAYEGNPHERHVTDNWTRDDFVSAFGEPYAEHIENEIGVFVFRKLKIAVYAISKNEEQFVKRFCDSAKDADMILIADTGSTDQTAVLATECGAVVHDICITPWRFDKARDAALALIPREFDVCISLDLDEVLEPGWREEIERVWKEDTTRLRYKFDWGCGISFFYEKIHHRHGYQWHHPCHEYPRPDARIKEVYAHTDKLLVSHHPDPTKSRGQYLDLLKLAVTEDPKCPRNAFYYARELTFYKQWQEAVDALKRYLEMPEATWENERCYAMRLLGKSYDELGNAWDAVKWYRRATAEAANTREPWVDLAMFCYRWKMWEECYAAAKRALAIKDKQLVYTCDPEVWGSKPHDLCALAAHHIGLKSEAMTQGTIAVSLSPNDSRLKANLEHYAA